MARYGLYQPFIEDRNVCRLYRLKLEQRERTGRKVPMTLLVNRILDRFFESGDALGSEEDLLRSDLATPKRSAEAPP